MGEYLDNGFRKNLAKTTECDVCGGTVWTQDSFGKVIEPPEHQGSTTLCNRIKALESRLSRVLETNGLWDGS